MTTLLHYDVALQDPFLRHEIAEAASDPLIFIEHDGKRIVAAGMFEQGTFERRDDIVDEFWSYQELGIDELSRDPNRPRNTIAPELVLRALRRLAADKVVVPPTLGIFVASYLADNGVELVVDEETWWERRRHKAPWELEGIERAQRAAENAMLAAARMLRDAEPTRDGRLRFEGEILTAELVRDAMQQELLVQRCECNDLLVQSGASGMRGHDPGTGPILPNETCIVDVWPRDMRTGVHSDMTRTFVPGTPSEEVKRIHADCRKALEIGLEAARPGASDPFRLVSDFFNERGYPTQLHHTSSAPLKEGFNHGLGHGVGLEVHERPSLGRRSDELAEGDVLTIEPGLYFDGVGGVRLEDTVVITAEGAEHFTDPMSYDLAP